MLVRFWHGKMILLQFWLRHCPLSFGLLSEKIYIYGSGTGSGYHPAIIRLRLSSGSGFGNKNEAALVP
jgi:hypothetical protein